MELDILHRILELQEKSLALSKTQYQRGFLPLQEVEKLSVDFENSKSRIMDAEVRQIQANATLSALLGHSDVQVGWPWKPGMEPEKIKPRVQSLEFPSTGLPSLVAAQSRLIAEERRQSRSWRLILPSLDLGFTYGYYSPENWADRSRAWTSSVSLTVPLFDRLANVSNYRAQTMARNVAEIAVEQTRRETSSQWISAKGSFLTTLDSAWVREQTLARSRKLYQDNVQRFQAGKMSANDLRQDQSRLLESELFTIQGWGSLHRAYARLCHASGRLVENCGLIQP